MTDPSPTKEQTPETEGTRKAVKVTAILLVAAAVLAFGFLEAKVLPRVRRAPDSVPRNAPELEDDVPLPEDDVLMGSEMVRFNGRMGQHLRCFSRRSPVEVVRTFEVRLKEQGLQARNERDPVQGAYFTRLGGNGYAMLAWRDGEGRRMGLVAYGDVSSGGCRYFVNRTEGRDGDVPDRGEDGDVPGSDIDGVIRPPASTREFCIEQHGRGPSAMALYESTASAVMIREFYLSRMPELRWEQPLGSEDALAVHPEGTLLSFKRGRETCMVNIVQDGDTTAVSLVYHAP